MIKSMCKLVVFLWGDKKESALCQLRDLGYLHLDLSLQHQNSASFVQYSHCLQAINIIKSNTYSGFIPRMNNYEALHMDYLPVGSKLNLIHQSQKDIKDLLDKEKIYQEQLALLSQWGLYNVDRLNDLKKVHVVFCQVDKKLYSAQDLSKYYVHYVGEDKEKIRFFLMSLEEICLPKEYSTIKFEKGNRKELEDKLSYIKKRYQECRAILKRSRQYIGELETYLSSLWDNLHLDTISTQMPVYHFDLACIHDKLYFFSAYLPRSQLKSFKIKVKQEKWGILELNIDSNDNVPTFFKESIFSRLMQPIYRFMSVIPGYQEFDISLIFLCFLTLFFSILLGDAGYAIVFFLITLGWTIYRQRKKKVFLEIQALLFVFSISTFIWGTLSGNWFFSQWILKQIPLLRSLVYPPLYTFNPASIENIKYFSLIIGFIHLSLAHIWRFWSYLWTNIYLSLAQLSNLAFIWAFFRLALYFVVDAEEYAIQADIWYVLGISLGMYFLFAYQGEGTFMQGVGRSFSQLLQIILSFTANFSDLISYIRLFAVGLAASSIAITFNTLSFNLVQKEGVWVGVGVLIFIFAHTINIIMGLLAILVHGLRLNILEFSTHVGLEWSGIFYRPFKKGNINLYT